MASSGVKAFEEMGVEFLGRDGGESARAPQGVPFFMDEAVIVAVVLRLEDVQEMIDDLLVAEFLKAAGALCSSRVSTFL
jgi:hypothetical protein